MQTQVSLAGGSITVLGADGIVGVEVEASMLDDGLVLGRVIPDNGESRHGGVAGDRGGGVAAAEGLGAWLCQEPVETNEANAKWTRMRTRSDAEHDGSEDVEHVY